jgi:anti-sigma regulatory factor (Ser/Thr protein kinase)
VPDGAPPAHERTLTVPARPASLDRIHDLVEDLWTVCVDVAPVDRMLFETAVTEIVGNIAEHAAGDGLLDVTVRVWVLPDRLEAEFRDRGRRADVDLENVALPDGLAESGRGLALTLAAVDELRYHRDGDVNHWHIVRRRGST